MPADQLITRQYALVVAHDQKLGIGKENVLPWKISADMQFFRKLTTKVTDHRRKNVVIMGRKTWQSIPKQFRPLSQRYNLVLTRTESSTPDPSLFFCPDFQQLFSTLESLDFENCFVIGGAQIYKQALMIKEFDLIYATEVRGDFHCDVYFPQYREAFVLKEQSPIQHEGEYTFQMNLYKRILV